MKHRLSIFICLFCMVCLVACRHDDDLYGGEQLVTLNIALEQVTDDVQVVTRALPSTLQLEASDFSVSVQDAGGVEHNVGCSYISSILVPASTYTIRAWYGDNPLLALDAPYFEGVGQVELPYQLFYVAPVEKAVVCKVANAIASVELYNHDGTRGTACFDQQFQPGYYIEVTIDGATPVRLAEGSHVYFRAGTAPAFTLHGVRKHDGATVAIPFARPTVSAGCHHIIKLSISASGDVILVSDTEYADDSPCLICPRS